MAQDLAASGGTPSDASLPTQPLNIFSVEWQPDTWTLDLSVGVPLVAFICVFVLIAVSLRWWWSWRGGGVMEIDQTEIGVGDAKISFRPNLTDRQVAYAIWVELSTRKIGLTINLEDDVISEIYDSWYNYFSVTRELIKTITVSKVRHDSTQKIINISIDVLNNGLRPHLTKWQARYRHWYELQIERIDRKADDSTILDPQALQQKFPKYDELSAELLAVNRRLIAYRASMQALVFDLHTKR